MIEFECPSCGHRGEVPDSAAGSQVRCAHCPAVLELPLAATLSARATTAAAPPGPQARCAVHPETAAAQGCGRCGDFMCAACSSGGQLRICPSCRARGGLGVEGFPFTPKNWSLGELFEYSIRVFQKQWVPLVVGLLIFGAAYVALGGLVSIGVLFLVIDLQEILKDPQAFQAKGFGAGQMAMLYGLSLPLYGVLLYLWLGYKRMILDALKGRSVDLAQLFSQPSKMFRTLGIVIIVFVPIGVLTTIIQSALTRGLGYTPQDPRAAFMALGLLAPQLVYYSFFLFIFQEILENERDGVIGTLGRIVSVGSGARLLAILLIFAQWFATGVGFMFCCVGALVTIPVSQLLISSVYLVLRQDEEGAKNP